MKILLSIIPIVLMALILLVLFYRQRSLQHNTDKKLQRLTQQFEALSVRLLERYETEDRWRNDLLGKIDQLKQSQHQQQVQALTLLQDGLQKGRTELRDQITSSLQQSASTLAQQINKLTGETNQRLHEISGQVEKRLSDGFEKTTATFQAVIERLAAIDSAQKKITELSNNVVSLQEVLTDKRTRGAFGEVQLITLIRNMLPEQSFAIQPTLSSGKRPDCLLYLPDGNVAIDAKFPLESYRRVIDLSTPESDHQQAKRDFRRDISKHIQDIAEKYIVPGETADGAVMFVPSEAVFSEIHAHYQDLVDKAQAARVWIVSPTTMMAVLTTARAVLKDAATRQQVHIIKEHLSKLNQDFGRFSKRMENLVRHIEQAHQDVKDVQTSSKKITSHFNKIEKVEFTTEDKKIAVIDEGG